MTWTTLKRQLRLLSVVSLFSAILNISIEGELLEEKVMSLELDLFDYKMTKLGFYSPGDSYGNNYQLKKGHFKIENIVNLPSNITKGEFFLRISLHLPDVEYYLNVKHDFVKIISKGFVGKTGKEFEYRRDGFLILE